MAVGRRPRAELQWKYREEERRPTSVYDELPYSFRMPSAEVAARVAADRPKPTPLTAAPLAKLLIVPQVLVS